MTNKSIRVISRPILRYSLFCFIFVISAWSTTYCCAIERQAVSDNGLVATYYYQKGLAQQPPIIFFGGSSGGNFYDNYQNYPEDLKEERHKYKPGCIPPYVAYRMQGMENSIKAERIYLEKKKEHPVTADIQIFYKAIFNIISNKITSE